MLGVVRGHVHHSVPAGIDLPPEIGEPRARGRAPCAQTVPRPDDSAAPFQVGDESRRAPLRRRAVDGGDAAPCATVTCGTREEARGRLVPAGAAGDSKPAATTLRRRRAPWLRARRAGGCVDGLRPLADAAGVDRASCAAAEEGPCCADDRERPEHREPSPRTRSSTARSGASLAGRPTPRRFPAAAPGLGDRAYPGREEQEDENLGGRDERPPELGAAGSARRCYTAVILCPVAARTAIPA